MFFVVGGGAGTDVVVSGCSSTMMTIVGAVSIDDDRWRGVQKRNSTRASHVVPHRSTSLARRRLTSQSGRDVVRSTWYGRS